RQAVQRAVFVYADLSAQFAHHLRYDVAARRLADREKGHARRGDAFHADVAGSWPTVWRCAMEPYLPCRACHSAWSTKERVPSPNILAISMQKRMANSALTALVRPVE